jgi:chromosome segregation ATPase
MTIVLVVLYIWGCSALIRAYSAKQSQREFQRIDSEIRQRKDEQKQMAQELAKQKRDAELYARKQIALEREQMKLAKEQQKQAEQIAKHDKRIADLEFRMGQAESDIQFQNDRIAQLDAQRDYLLLQQSGTVPGGKEHTKLQNKIMVLDNQIHAAEARLAKAQHTHDMAERELSA